MRTVDSDGAWEGPTVTSADCSTARRTRDDATGTWVYMAQLYVYPNKLDPKPEPELEPEPEPETEPHLPQLDLAQTREQTAEESRRSQRGQLAHTLWRTAFGGARFVCAPMVLQSECAFRMLVRQHGCGVCWSPMAKAIHTWPTTFSADVVADLSQCRDLDRPLVAQLGAADRAGLLSAAKLVEPHCDAVDLNLGCPQRTAAEDGFGAFLMDDPSAVSDMISALAAELSVPIFAKCRIFPELEQTLEFVKMLESAGCSLITVHGRTRDNTTHDGPCDWSAIRACVDAVRIPVIANGAVHSVEDALHCLEQTGAVAVMGATGLLRDPQMFARTTQPLAGEQRRDPFVPHPTMLGVAFAA